MQRRLPEGIVIACDFCGRDWDEVFPMIEGHEGSVVCLACLEQAYANARPAGEAFKCVMCLREQDIATRSWRHPSPLEGANPKACICEGCIDQAADAFDADPDVTWKKPR